MLAAALGFAFGSLLHGAHVIPGGARSSHCPARHHGLQALPRPRQRSYE
ncbi:MAG: hypothetical protein MZV64_28560 [Ignavibacteriales bacterium]|nr:hypothetical protein [Ignavibacteriales bacterium]